MKDYTLVVGEPDHLLSDALREATLVTRCPGSAAVECPAMGSRSCAVRENARATIVFVSDDSEGQRRLTCLGAAETPVVAVIEGSTVGPIVTGDFAVVGAGSGPIGILGAIAGVIEAGENHVRSSPPSEGPESPGPCSPTERSRVSRRSS